MTKQGVTRIAWSPREVADMTGLHYQSVISGIHAGDIPATKVGSRYIVPAWWVEQVATGSAERRSA